MSIDLATSKCRIFLKQIRIDDLCSIGRAAMDFCFDGFSKSLSPDSQYVREGKKVFAKRFGKLGVEGIPDLSLMRRYSGDHTLGRARYFSVCKDSNGNDDGTLMRELSAYRDPTKSGLITVLDPTVPSNKRLVPQVLREDTSKRLLLLFPPVGGKAHPFAARFSEEPKPLYVNLPVRVIETEIENVVDLRCPDTAEWFAKSLSQLTMSDFFPNQSLEPIPMFPFKPALNSFGDLLPTLLTQSTGGGRGELQSAGLWLRKLGVSGVVFPSSRSDCKVSVKKGKIKSWSGFCFVDYRDSRSPEIQMNVDFSIGWPEKVQMRPDDFKETNDPIVYDTVTTHFKNRGDRKGSWSVQGIEVRRTAMYHFCELTWLFDELFGRDDQDANKVLTLAYNFLVQSWRPELSRDLISAMMGKSDSNHRIIRYAASKTFHQELPGLEESVRSVLERARCLGSPRHTFAAELH